MGKSNTIEQEAKKNRAFNQFLGEQQERMKAISSELKDDVIAQQVRFYKHNDWKDSSVMTYQFDDWQTTSTWSLDNVIAIVQKIGDAITGKVGSDLPAGNETPPDEQTVNAIKDQQPAIAGRINNIQDTVIALIGGMMQSFKEVNSIQSQRIIRNQPLGFGLHLFFGMDVSVYSRKEFFKNDFIQQYGMFFTVTFSAEEAVQQSKIDIAETIGLQIESNNRLKLKNAEVHEKNASIALEESNLEMFQNAENFYHFANDKLNASNKELLTQQKELIDLHKKEKTEAILLRAKKNNSALAMSLMERKDLKQVI